MFLLVLFLTNLLLQSRQNNVLFVHAECSLKDEKDQKVVVSALPPGVDYDRNLDRLRCMEPDACRFWTILNCYVVQCKNHQACKGATMINNRGVACEAAEACQETKFIQSHNVVCGLDATEPACPSADIESDTIVLCYGPQACASVADKARRTTIRVGAEGVVRCGNGQGQFACQNLLVQVNHSRRACFGKKVGVAASCAVLCETDTECDKSSIHFEVK
ncbi:hypothetical protein ACA910_011219 [Epithemia clementina (nom. ined.)]